MIQEAPYPGNLFTRETMRETLYHILFFPRVARAARAPSSDLRQINSAILKVPDAAWNCYVLGTDACRGTVPMELRCLTVPSMQHREPIK